eukprot:TRINITY_DN49576_c0_g1_i1.p2 TRINITY_DN49576_c0_g1~~TRINITY_DN49576_c0_g1_i1.p2  ORF type:complete len:177 (+),score=30.44 TRINITY_DN49576_c0_g1_i1:160-690(+)
MEETRWLAKGVIVWAKMATWPWYPAVVDEINVGGGAKHEVHFAFPGCSDWGSMELPRTALKPFDQDFSKHAKKAGTNPNLKLGISEALIAFRDKHGICNHQEMARRLGVPKDHVLLYDVPLLGASGWGPRPKKRACLKNPATLHDLKNDHVDDNGKRDALTRVRTYLDTIDSRSSS